MSWQLTSAVFRIYPPFIYILSKEKYWKYKNMEIFFLLFYVSMHMLFVPFMALCLLFAIYAFEASWRLCLHYTFKFQHSLCIVTYASSLFSHTQAHTHIVYCISRAMCYERFPCGMSLMCMAGGEICVVGEEGERWCVKTRLICLWLALIKVSPRRAVNTHRDSLVI